MKKILLILFLASACAFAQSDDAKKGKKQTSQAKVLNRAEIDALLAKPDQRRMRSLS